jgi:uncharacterized phage protein gp47/JayE
MAEGGEMMSDPDYLKDADTQEAAIRGRMLAKVTNTVDKSEGSYVWDSLSPVAIEMVFIRMALQKALKLGFAQTVDAENIDYLVMRAEEHGVYRKAATYATGSIHITGKPKTVVPSGLKLATEADADLGIKSIFFLTTESITIPDGGEADIPIKAAEAGAAGDVSAGSIVLLATARKNVYSLTNPAATTGGTDDESLESLLSRYLEKVRNPGTSGNKADYKQWATSVNGVGEAHVIPLWNGEGTVKVVVLGADKKPAAADIVAAVQAYINETAATGDRMAPIGATVTVVPASTVSMNLDATIVMNTSAGVALSAIQESLAAALEAYLSKMAFQTSTIRYSRIGAIILDQTGVVDYSSLTINGQTGNLALKEDEVAIVGTVTLHAE